jgi:hypothetical protein
MRLACLILVCLVTTAAVSTSQEGGDEIVLKDGRRFTGVIQWETESHVGLKVDFGLIQLEKKAIKEVMSRDGGVTINLRGQKGIMNLSGPDADPTKAVKKKKVSPEEPPSSEIAPIKTPPEALLDPGKAESAEKRKSSSPLPDDPLLDSHEARRSRSTNVLSFLENIKGRLGPFFPERPSSQIALTVVLFLIILGLVQIGCRFIEIENFSLARGLAFNTVLVLVVFAAFTIRNVLSGPLQIVLAVLVGFVVMTTATAALFQEHAGRSTMLVTFVTIAGGICFTFITVGVIGVMNLN